MEELLRGELFFGVPNLFFATVDVRDVATSHVRAAGTPAAAGRRYVIVSGREMVAFVDVARTFRELGGRSLLIPTHRLPDPLVRLIGPLFGLTQLWIARNLGVRFDVDNSRAVEELGMEYRPLAETLADHHKAWTALRQ
jgi:nucleoside-diphosphate-sugar epimerase